MFRDGVDPRAAQAWQKYAEQQSAPQKPTMPERKFNYHPRTNNIETDYLKSKVRERGRVYFDGQSQTYCLGDPDKPK